MTSIGQTQQQRRGVRRPEGWIPVFLVVLVTAVYGQVYRFDFVNYDDPQYVYDNPFIRNGFSREGLVEVFTHGHHALWLPLTSVTYMLGCEIYGVNAAADHLTNVLFHAINVVLLFWALRKLTGAVWPSAFAAALFAVHPLNVESVAWVSGRKELVYTAFWLLTLLAYGAYARRPALKRYLLVVLCHALGLAAKSSQMTLPCVLLLLDYWPLGRCRPSDLGRSEDRKKVGRLVLEKLPLLALSVPVALSAYVIVGRAGGMRSLDAVPLATRIPNTIWVYGFYLAKLVWPSGLALHYPYPTDPLPHWQTGLALAVLIGVTAACLWFLRKCPYLAVGWFWFLGTLFPVSGFWRATTFLMADRYAYVPLMGLFIMLAWSGAAIVAHVPKAGRALAAGAAAGVLALAICAAIQTHYWRNSITLFQHALEVTPRNYLAHKNLGTAFAYAGQFDRAASEYRKGLEIEPDDVEARASLAEVLAQTGRPGEAVDEYRRAIATNRDVLDIHFNLGNLLAKQGRFQEAIGSYSEVLRLRPDHWGTTMNTGNALASLGEFEKATTFFLKAFQLKPDSLEACLNLGRVYATQKQFDEAARYYRKAAQIEPDNPNLLCDLGQVLLNQGKPQEAAAAFKRALDIDPDNTTARDALKTIEPVTLR